MSLDFLHAGLTLLDNTPPVDNLTIPRPPHDICPYNNRTIRVGYVKMGYPFQMSCITQPNWMDKCHNPGISIEAIRILARYYHCNIDMIAISGGYGDYYFDKFGHLGGLMGHLVNGTVDVGAHWLNLTPNRMNGTHASQTIGIGGLHYGFVQGYNLTMKDQQKRFLHLNPFANTVLLLYGSLILIQGLSQLNTQVIRNLWAEFASVVNFWPRHRSFANGLWLFGALAMHWLYYAGFRSSILATKVDDYNGANLMNDLKFQILSGEKIVLLPSYRQMLTRERKTYFGTTDLAQIGNRLQIVKDYDRIRHLICSHEKYVYYGQVLSFYRKQSGREMAKHMKCGERIIPLMLAFIAESKIVRPSSYIFAPHVSRKLREKMRQIILLLYNDEAYFRYWYPRYGINRGAARQMHKFVKENALGVGGESNTKARNNFQVSKASAILVEEILDGIYFWLCGMTFCCIYLIFELLFSRALLMDVKLKHKASVVEEVVHVPYLY